MKRVAIRDVAAEAGVSRSSVSNYLNHPDLLKTATRDRIASAIERLGFVPSDAARNIGSGDRTTIGYIAFELTNPFSGVIGDSIERRAMETGFTVLTCNSAGSPARQLEYMNLFERRRVAGLIVSPLSDIEPELLGMRKRGTPSVIMGRMAVHPTQSSVSVADSLGGEIAARHLLDIGRRDLVFVGGPLAVAQVSERFEGAARAIKDVPGASLSLVAHEDRTISGGIEAAHMILRRRVRPDAVFAVNDLVGLGVIEGLQANGVRVPEDIAVIGFDGDEIGAFAATPLSTVRASGELVGRHAYDLLMEVISDAEAARQLVVEPTLVLRDSSARAS